MDRLDDTDERILAELAENARATFAEIGECVNLSAPAVKRRVDRMLDSGVIRGFTTVVDRNALGWNTEAYVQVYCHGRIAPSSCAPPGSTFLRSSAPPRSPGPPMPSCMCWLVTCAIWSRHWNGSGPPQRWSAARALSCSRISSSAPAHSPRPQHAGMSCRSTVRTVRTSCGR